MQTASYTVLISLALVAIVRGQGNFTLTATNSINYLYIDNQQITPLPNYGDWGTIDTVPLETYARLIAIRVNNVLGGCSGLLAATVAHPLGHVVVSNRQWKCSASPMDGWQFLGFDDSSWTAAHEVGRNGAIVPGCPWIPLNDMPTDAYWIWTPAHTDGDMVVSCRGYIPICDDSPCQNNGTCQDNDVDLCRCPVRFGGRFCEEDINECDSNPCLNGGHCNLSPDGYQCECGLQFTGTRCETDVTACASAPCKNGGTCIFVDDHYICDCPPGFSGFDCETDIDECESDPCLNGASCEDGINSVTCSCAPGYTGVLCQNEIDECNSNPCQNAGTCHDMLNGYACTCHPGYTGTHCETATGNCVANPCLNGGTCTLGGPGGSVECICPPDWLGTFCDNSVNKCISNPCKNGGTCIDGPERFDCICERDFTGTFCEAVVPSCGSIMKDSEYAPTRNYWSLCEINLAEHQEYLNTPCRDLIVDIPYYKDADTITAMGGTFGCFRTKYPDEYPHGACVPDYAQDATLASCLSCTVMGVCIDVPPPL